MAAPTVLIKFVDVLVADTARRVPTVLCKINEMQRLTFVATSGHS